MRTVKSRKELIAGIKAGERKFKIENASLLLQCKLASMFNNGKAVSKSAVNSAVPVAATQCGITASTTIGLSIIAVVGAIAIISILSNKHLKIEVESEGLGRGTITIS